MIVKETPVGQGVPDFETVRKLSRYAGDFFDFSPIFYDIETTGLSKKTSQVYLIGAVFFENKEWILRQWFAQNPQEEAQILAAFGDFLKKGTCTVQYNGDHFDQPFLTSRSGLYALPDPFSSMPSIDLYKHLLCCRNLFRLPHMKQPDLEELLQTAPRRYCDGREGIRIYKEYIKNPLPQLTKEVMGHNREDLEGLLKIYRLLSCLALFCGDFSVSEMSFHSEELCAVLSIPEELPAALCVSLPGFQLRGEKREIRLLIRAKDGKLRRFYANYRDYVYLPGEDTAVPRSLSTFMEKRLYVPANKDTCYTWFPVSGRFLSDSRLQAEYFQSILSYYLS